MSVKGARGYEGHTGRHCVVVHRPREPWHPGSRGQWYLWVVKQEGAIIGREQCTSEDTAGAGSVSGGGEDCTEGDGDGSDLSHLSLLFLQGSQLMAFLARFVGGRASWSLGGGDVLERTLDDDGRCCFWRGPGVAEDGESWAGGSSGMTSRRKWEDGDEGVFSVSACLPRRRQRCMDCHIRKYSLSHRHGGFFSSAISDRQQVCGILQFQLSE